MELELIDWAMVCLFFVIALSVGAIVSRRAGSSASEFFLSGRHMPWWLLGFSMVATTFAADTPLLVTNIVRQNGVAGNWAWWAFLLTGMLTVFVYAKLWRRSGILTDLEFYELRYSGRAAAFLRGFRAIYLGVFFNVLVMANVTLAAIKIGHVMLGFSPLETILIASLVTVCFSAMGGLRGVLLTDFLLFIVAMIGSIGAAIVALSHAKVGGISALLEHAAVRPHLALVPPLDFSTRDAANLAMSILVVPLAVQWWSVWYPGAEPGGGGYIAQRMLAAKSEKHATGATLFFNCAHYALRPWPWIIVALASLIVFPDLGALQQAYPDLPSDKVQHDLAYPAMLTFLPVGLRGIVVASLIAAYMSTISTHLNWGSSYVVNDVWKRFLRPEASERSLVRLGRLSTVVMMILAAGLALMLEDALQGFHILLQVGAGTGLLFILRWLWWRVNPFSELAAMVVSFLVALAFLAHDKWVAWLARLNETTWYVERLTQYGMDTSISALLAGGFEGWHKIVLGVALTTACWLAATFLTRPDDPQTLRAFYRRVHPGGPGWRRVVRDAARDGDAIEDPAAKSSLALGLACMVTGCLGVYAALFATGYLIYGYLPVAVGLGLLSLGAALFLAAMWNRVHE